MPALTPNQISALARRLGAYKTKAQHYIPLELTEDEVLDYVARPEERKILKDAAVISASDSGGVLPITLPIPEFLQPVQRGHLFVTLEVMGRRKDRNPIHLPRNPQFDEDAPAHKKICAFIEAQLVVARDLALTKYVLDKLNQACTSATTMRYVWPALLSLCRVGPDGPPYIGEVLDPLALRIEAFKQPRKAPTLSPKLREACRYTAGRVTAVGLLPPIPSDVWRPINVRVEMAGTIEFKGLRFHMTN